MRRRFAACLIAVAVGFLGASSMAGAQPSTKGYRIGWLATGSPPTGADRSVTDFQEGLRNLGYVVDKNVTIEYRFASGSGNRLSDHAAELTRLPIDVIVASGVPVALAAKRDQDDPNCCDGIRIRPR